jgi:hypothetical protein
MTVRLLSERPVGAGAQLSPTVGPQPHLPLWTAAKKGLPLSWPEGES